MAPFVCKVQKHGRPVALARKILEGRGSLCYINLTMSRICIKNGTVVLPHALLKNAPVLIDGAKIVLVGGKIKPPKNATTIDARGCFISPGFIDTHIHGTPEEIFKNEIRFGTTSIVIAESCAPLDEIFRKIREIKEFTGKNPFGRNLLGVRLEGPYISKEKAGAQDERYIRSPDKKEALKIIKECDPLLRIVTIAPELKGAIAIIKLLKYNKIIASMGHSNATYEEAVSGIATGINHATHIFNAMRIPDKREPGASTAALLADSVMAEIILDLIHVPKALFDLLIKVKGVDKTILITDSVRAEKRPDVKKIGGVYKFKSGTIAGSSLTTIDALENSVKECGLSLTDAVKMLTVNPAKLLHIERRKGKIAVGMDADIVIFDKDFTVKTTIINGNIIYRQKGFRAE